MLPHRHAPKLCSWTWAGRSCWVCGDHDGTMQGPCRDTQDLAPYLPSILSWCPIFSLGTQAASQHPAWSPHGMGTGMGGMAESTRAL